MSQGETLRVVVSPVRLPGPPPWEGWRYAIVDVDGEEVAGTLGAFRRRETAEIVGQRRLEEFRRLWEQAADRA